jgi:hypothetical protein
MTEVKAKRTRGNTPFDEAKRAQEKLDKLESQRQEVIDGLSGEAAAMLGALDELRAQQPIPVAPSSPDSTA